MNKKRNPFFIYWLLAVAVLIALNIFVYPSVLENRAEQVSYNRFLNEIINKNIDAVQVDVDNIYFSLKSDAEQRESEPSNLLKNLGRQKIYSTVKMDDERLVDRLYDAGATFSRVAPKKVNPVLSFAISYIFPVIIFVIIWQFLMRQMTKGGNMMSFGKSSAKVYVKAQTGKSFADVAGQEEAKAALMEIVDILHNPAKYSDIGAVIPKGVLLVGPPGTGKTLLARAVAGEANVPFFSISGSEFVEMFVGMGAAKVRDLFRQANEKAPCIVFIDEIDTIGKKRDGQGISGNDEREQTLNQLLSEMDGFDGKNGVVILAATNRPESLDKALLRPGRFDRRVPVELPDLNGRIAILKVHAQKVRCSEEIDFSKIARATSGASGAELANIVNEAALRAVRLSRIVVTQKDFEESVDVILAGYKRKGMVITEKEREIIAFHEVGHAIAASVGEAGSPVHKITIVPRTSGALGFTMQTDDKEHYLMSKEEVFAKIVTLTAGRAAEKLVFDSITTGAANDIEKATAIARSMVTRYGMSEKFGMVALENNANRYLSENGAYNCSPETQTAVDREVTSIVNAAQNKAFKILGEYRDKLTEIAHRLMDKETMSGEEFEKMLKF